MHKCEIIKAERAGFCSGVKGSFNRLLQYSEKYGSGSTLGPLVHNSDVIDYLEKRSINVIHNPDDADKGFVAIRTHGISPLIKKKLQQKKQLAVLDLTCPHVKKVQKIVADLSSKGIQVIIFGDRLHPEVVGLVGWADENAYVVKTKEELAQLNTQGEVALVAQTTACPNKFREAQEYFKHLYPSGIVEDTICQETERRLQEALTLAQRVDFIIVVGSAESANTNALFEYCRQLKPACRITNARELDRLTIKKYNKIGITAGASTPPWTIKEVMEKLENDRMDVENEERFEFTNDIRITQPGEQVKGKVARVTDDEVFVDIGSKTEAILPAKEVHLGEGETLAEKFAPEDDIEVTVLEIDDQEGVIVSHRLLGRKKREEELKDNYENQKVMKGLVKHVVKAGVIVDLGAGIEGFLPGSQMDVKYLPDFKEFVNEEIEFMILEHDDDKNKIILSRKKVIEGELNKQREETLKNLKVGTTIPGIVKRLTKFGAFIDIGGIDGLIHISELSWDHVTHPSEVLKVDDKVEVSVLEVSPKKERISLSLRKTMPDPWHNTIDGLESGQVINGKVTRLTDFGAFVELFPGVEGLAHISQLADYHIEHPSEILKVGEKVEVKVLDIKHDNKRISLGLNEMRGSSAGVSFAGAEDESGGSVTIGDLFGDLFSSEGLLSVNDKKSQ